MSAIMKSKTLISLVVVTAVIVVGAVVAVTSLDDNRKKEEYLRHGFDDFLSKPIAVPNSIKTVADMFGPAPFTVH